MTTVFAPHLFVRNISKNVTKDSLWTFFSNLGFGDIENIVIKPRAEKNNAIVYFQQWAMEETAITRNMLKEGRALSITHEDGGAIWKVSALDETRCGSVRNFPDILPPNVTDNRAERRRNRVDNDVTQCFAPTKAPRSNEDAAREFLDDLRIELFPLDSLVPVPFAPVPFAPVPFAPVPPSTIDNRTAVEQKLVLEAIDDPVPPVANPNQPVAIDYGNVIIPPKRRHVIIKK
jgi:hypothetical protein